MTDLEHFSRRKAALEKGYEDLIELVKGAGVFAEAQADVKRLESVRSGLEGELKCRVLCIGDFSTGKSSFINRFLLNDEVLPAWATPTTAQITKLRFGERLKATRYQVDGEDPSRLKSESITTDLRATLQHWVAFGDRQTDSEQALPIDIEAPSALLEAGIEIVDAPGLNDPNPERMRLTLDYLNQADAILFFINATKPWTRYEKDVFEGEVLTRDMLDRVFVILSYWDLVDFEQREEVIDYVRSCINQSLGYDPYESCGQPVIPVLPVSAKTGENAQLIENQVWDVLSQRKAENVLASRIATFNREALAYRDVVGRRIDNLGLDSQGRSKRRSRLLQEVKDYDAQRQSFRADLKRLLHRDFEDYQDRFERLFDELVDKLAATPHKIGDLKDVKDFNRKLSQHVSRLHAESSRKLSNLGSEFPDRVRNTIETHKATIGALPKTAVTVEDYFLDWRGADGQPILESAPYAAGGAGLAGVLLGLGTLWQSAVVTTATPGVITTIGTWLFGGPAAAVSSFMLVGVPALAIGGLLIGAAFYTKHRNASNLRTALQEAAVELADNVEAEKWKIIDQLKNSRRRQINQICDNVDDDISRAWRERLEELRQVEQDESRGAVLASLHGQLAGLTLKVNA